MMSLRSGQEYESLVNNPEEDKCDDGDCSTAALSKKKLGLYVICFGILFISFNKLDQFSGRRHTIGVFSGRRNTMGGTHEKGREMNRKDAPVFGIMEINVALDGLASQSSIGFSGFASRANDGNTKGSATHSNHYERQPWWKVDLLGTFPIHTVKLFNRQDCCQETLQQFQVQLLDPKGNIVASKDYGDYYIITTSLSMFFDDIEASQVKVLMKDTGVNRVLSLTEVEVFVDGR